MSLLKYMFCVVYRRLFEPSVNKKNVRDSRLEMLIASIYIYRRLFLLGGDILSSHAWRESLARIKLLNVSNINPI